jgi:hypothetical protein
VSVEGAKYEDENSIVKEIVGRREGIQRNYIRKEDRTEEESRKGDQGRRKREIEDSSE